MAWNGILHLLAASLIWAFSFGLIKTQLAGIDPALVAFLRLALAAVVFAPWLARPLGRGRALAFVALGAVQFGAMYLFYLAAYRTLPAYGVAIATIVTPLYVVAIEDAWRRRFRARHLLAALLAVAGAAVVQLQDTEVGAWQGVLLVQAANLCFATGQVFYRRLASSAGAEPRGRDTINLAWMYLGAAILTGAATLVLGDRARWAIDTGEWLAIAYLGVLPTALGFYLWNRGAPRTPPGVLAVANNLKVPLAVLIAWLVFAETIAGGRVIGGLILLVGALSLAREGDARPV